MKSLRLDSVLLFALVVPFIMGYRIGPSETPYPLFGVIFLLLLSYIIIDFFSLPKRLYSVLKQAVLWLVICIVVGSSFVSAIIVRHQTAPIYMIHDIIIQQEQAIRFFLDGKNPYKETYFGTPLEKWHYDDKEVNPALYHFVMEPFYILFALPFYFISNVLFGFFDARLPLMFLFFALFVMAALLVKDEKKRSLFLILLAFHPSVLAYTLEGRSDIFMFTFLFAGFYLLEKKEFVYSAIAIGLAAVVKQSAWFVLPFYFLYIYFTKKSVKTLLPSVFAFLAVFLVITVPFYLWDKEAFFRSTISYLSGNTEHSYPISGYGLSSLLLQLGVIPDKYAYYPFVIWQIIICIPLFGVLSLFLKRNRSVKTLILVHAIFLFVFWYFSRYFNNSHIAYISLLFITAYFWPEATTHEKAQ